MTEEYRASGGTSLPARGPSPGAPEGAGPAGFPLKSLVVRTPPLFVLHVRRCSKLSYTHDSIVLSICSHHRFGLRAEAEEFLVLGLLLLHPLHALVVPLAGLVFVAQAPVRHGQEETVKAIAAFAEIPRL